MSFQETTEPGVARERLPQVRCLYESSLTQGKVLSLCRTEPARLHLLAAASHTSVNSTPDKTFSQSPFVDAGLGLRVPAGMGQQDSVWWQTVNARMTSAKNVSVLDS